MADTPVLSMLAFTRFCSRQIAFDFLHRIWVMRMADCRPPTRPIVLTSRIISACKEGESRRRIVRLERTEILSRSGGRLEAREADIKNNKGANVLRNLASFMVVLSICAAGFCGPASAQESFPNRTITIVVAFAAGGTSDIIARLLGAKMSEYTGTSVVVEDVPGAACMTGTEKVAHANPDGYTLYLASSTPFATNPNFYHHLRYSLDDFEPITLAGAGAAGIRCPQRIFPLRPSRNSSIMHASSRTASPSPRPDAAVSAKSSTAWPGGILNIHITDVPYPGSTPAVADLMKGVVDSYFDAISSTLPLIQSRHF